MWLRLVIVLGVLGILGTVGVVFLWEIAPPVVIERALDVTPENL